MKNKIIQRNKSLFFAKIQRNNLLIFAKIQRNNLLFLKKFQSTNNLLKFFFLLKTVLFYCHRKYQSHNTYKISLIKSKPISGYDTHCSHCSHNRLCGSHPIASTIARTPINSKFRIQNSPPIQNSISLFQKYATYDYYLRYTPYFLRLLNL